MAGRREGVGYLFPIALLHRQDSAARLWPLGGTSSVLNIAAPKFRPVYVLGDYGIIGSEPGRRRRSRFDAWNLAGPRPTTTCGYFPAAGGPAAGGRARPRRRWQQSRGQSATLRAVMAKVESQHLLQHGRHPLSVGPRPSVASGPGPAASERVADITSIRFTISRTPSTSATTSWAFCLR